MKPKRCPSDLSRTQGNRFQPLLPPAQPGGPPRQVNLRAVLHGILSLAWGGCSWRMRPKDLPPGSTCSDSFRKGRHDGTWQTINDPVRTQVRHRHRRNKSPSRVDSRKVVIAFGSR
jgi:putative transposase